MKFIDTKIIHTFAGKHALVRVDWNVPCQEGVITDPTRLFNTKETLTLLQKQGAKVIVLAHFGRPTLAKKAYRVGNATGQVTHDLFVMEDEFSFKALLPQISQILDLPIDYVENPLTSHGQACLRAMQNGTIVLCDNVRFFGGEESNDQEFAQQLAALADFYVNEAFSCSHRAHASVEAIAHKLPAYAGISLAAEVLHLNTAFFNPKRPLWAIVAGSKVSTKIDLLLNLSQKVDGLIIGGAMANTFLKAQGIGVGKSLVEDDHIETANAILKSATAEIVLPVDGVAAENLVPDTNTVTVDYGRVPDNLSVFDVGSKSSALFKNKLQSAQTVIWNGPIGVFEHDAFAGGTAALAHMLADLTKQGVTTLAGGGDTLAALAKSGGGAALSYCSTAGGAFLECLEGKELPGVKALG